MLLPSLNDTEVRYAVVLDGVCEMSEIVSLVETVVFHVTGSDVWLLWNLDVVVGGGIVVGLV